MERERERERQREEAQRETEVAGGVLSAAHRTSSDPAVNSLKIKKGQYEATPTQQACTVSFLPELCCVCTICIETAVRTLWPHWYIQCRWSVMYKLQWSGTCRCTCVFLPWVENLFCSVALHHYLLSILPSRPRPLQRFSQDGPAHQEPTQLLQEDCREELVFWRRGSHGRLSLPQAAQPI